MKSPGAGFPPCDTGRMGDLRRAGIPRIVAAVLLCNGVGAAGIPTVSRGIDEWYGTLEKPGFTPPNWVFGPVWTILYTLMGIALAIVSKHDEQEMLRQKALGAFGVQLVLNALWSPLFFGRRSLFTALVEIVLLVTAVAVTVGLFLRISRLAGLLLIPYLAWVVFATALNGGIWNLNR